MNEKGNRYAIAALKDRRPPWRVRSFKCIRHREEQLTHLDATLRVLDRSYRADSIPPKRLRRVKLFGSGELNQLIADALRRAEKPLGRVDIAAAIVEAKGYGRPSIHALTLRVRANLSYLLRHKRVVKAGDRLTARWTLPAE
jgi:hypothetical protein